jgi:hypothetical protein
MLHSKRSRRTIAVTLLLVMLTNILTPTVTYALTSGPTVPEATSFEPIDTTDMVNLQTGDFTYNIPMLEVPGPEGGYPLALSYHAGLQPNEDASWVGLGWTLNPGAIARSVNGYPDDWYSPSNYSHVYWSGGQRNVYSVGLSIGISGVVSAVSFGLSVSTDTYEGFSMGGNVGVGFRIKGTTFGIGVEYGVTPYGDPYLGGGINYAMGIANSGFSASASLGFSTNFESVDGNFSGGVSYGKPRTAGDKHKSKSYSLLKASIGTGSSGASFEVGGMKSNVESTHEAKVRTSSSGFSISIPFGFGDLSLGHTKTRYWIDDRTNVTTHGSIHSPDFGVVTDHDYDTYALLEDPSLINIIDNPDPVKLQGGAFLNFDQYSVNAQGVGGEMRPYYYQGRILSNNQKKANNDPLVTFFAAGPTPYKPSFRFVNDFSNSFRQGYAQYGDPNQNLRTATPPLDTGPTAGHPDNPSYGIGPGNKLAGSRHIEIGPQIKPSVATGYNKLQRYLTNMIEGFSITNESGVTYHFGLPAYAYDEESYSKKIDESGGLSFNRSTKSTAYAYTWYLTTVTGPDFVDRNADGIADTGDWGYWVNFEYGKWSNNYSWRNPSEGYHRDEDNEFQNVSMGKKEVYYLNAIRTRTHAAIFEKDLRHDGKGTSPSSFAKNSVASISGIWPFSMTTTYTTLQNTGVYDYNATQSLRLNRIYLLNAVDGSFVGPNSGSLTEFIPNRAPGSCSDCEYMGNVVDRTDVDAVDRSQLEAKAIRIVEFEYDYSLCAGTKNSFDAFAGPIFPTQGKLTLKNVIMRGKGGTALLPPTKFEYELSGTDVVTATGTLTSTSFTTTNGNLNVGDLLRIDDFSQLYCGAITSKTPSGGNYIYAITNSLYAGGASTKIMRTTKNPPYNKDAYDMWGMYKSDINTVLIANNENLARKTTEVSSKAVDVWSLRKIRNPLGADLKIKLESDTYLQSFMNQNNSLIMKSLSILADRQTITFSIENYGQTIETGLSIGTKVSPTICARYMVLSRGAWNEADLGKMTITNISGSTYTGVLDIAIPASINGGEIFTGLITGNLSVKTNGDNYGGGVRVANVSVTTPTATVSTHYSYNDANNPSITSGVTTYLPSSLDPVDAAAILNAQFGNATHVKWYKRILYENIENLYAISRELPPPGVMYEYTTVTTKVKNIDEQSARDVPGKTVYQFQVYRKNMVGRETIGTQSAQSPFGPMSVKNMAIKKFTAAMGAVRRIIQYDDNGKKLAETINHYLHDGLDNLDFTSFMSQYKTRLAPYNYQGYIQERTSEVKEILNSGAQNGVLATLCGKEEYPMVPTGTTHINYVNGTQVKSETIGFDFYSGAITKTVDSDEYGNRVMTEMVPAYKKAEYAAMGLKVNTGTNKHMLTQIAAVYTRKVDATNASQGIIAASATTWSNSIQAMDAAGTIYTQNNPGTSVGNVWRTASNWEWLPENKTTNGFTATGSFSEFNFTTPASSHANWKKVNEVTRYDVNSHDLEGRDIYGIYTSHRMGYNASKVVVSGSQTKYYEFAFSGGEDALVSGKFGGGVAPGGGTATDAFPVHTGHKSLRLAGGTNGDGFTYTANVSDLSNTQDYIAFVWARNQTSGAPTLSLYYQTGAGSKVYPTNLTSGQSSDGWFLYSVKIPAAAVSGGSTLKIGAEVSSNSVGVLMDDFRFQPMKASTKAYVYDKITGQLTFVLNNNNTYSKYEYDAAGRITKTYLETIKNGGVKLISEYEYNHGEPVFAFLSDPIVGDFTKNDCPLGEAGTNVFINFPSGAFTSNISSAIANAKAQAAAQKYANANGTCTTATTTISWNNSLSYHVTLRFYIGTTLMHEETIGDFDNGTFTLPDGVYDVVMFTVGDNTANSYFYDIDGHLESSHSANFTGITITGYCNIDIY